MLPDSYCWLDSAEASYLRRGYRWVAVVRAGQLMDEHSIRDCLLAALCEPTTVDRQRGRRLWLCRI